MKYCGNCEWSFSENDVENIMKELNYDEDIINRPIVGDCCLSIFHNGNYVCDEHSYIKDSLTWIIYDEKQHEICYFLTAKYDEENIHTISISMNNIVDDTKRCIEIPICCKYSYNKLFSLLNSINSMINNNEILFDNYDVKKMKRILKI